MNNENCFIAQDDVIRSGQLTCVFIVNSLRDFPVLPCEQVKRCIYLRRALWQPPRICSVVETAILGVTD